jgi:hypothetical protein
VKVSASRKSTHSVMAHSGFGDLTIHTPEGVTLNIPQEQITAEGNIKRHVLVRSQELTRENCEYLESKGIRLFVGKRSGM